ncbi:hypothetical protein WJX73_001146 [Symbiochloris irregularis]|uniref:MPN domain-containing protein n=1 Tax=Symbiochloris irregularis TaxID=706552 RepID=A0AAW1PL98_9CHLO
MPAARKPSASSSAAVPDIPKLAVNHQIRLDYYLRSGNLLVRQADLYRRNGDDRQLYTMLMRFASLIVETLPDHKDFRRNQPPAEYARLKKLLASSLFQELEAVKASLRLKGEELSQTWRQPESHTPGTEQVSTSSLQGLDWSALSGLPGSSGPSGLTAAPPGTYSFSGPLDLLSGDAVAPAQHQPVMLPTFDASAFSSYAPASHEARARHALLAAPSERRRPAAPRASWNQALPYPTFDASPVPPIAWTHQSAASGELADSLGQVSLMDAPAAPSSAPHMAALDAASVSPQLELQLGPQEIEVHPQTADGGHGTCAMPVPAEPDPGTTDALGGVSKQRHEVREVHISLALIEDFMKHAISNTQRNIETCGILGGTLDAKRGLFNLNLLVVPKQKGTTDMVEMLNEEEILDAFDSRTPHHYPLGWIHTHPAFTCFLSSIDMHTQCPYQMMMDEAVAIVMAPRDSKQRLGIFRLSTPGGLKLIEKCDQRGFHSHSTPSTGQPIYELCGHVFLNPRTEYSVVDLR